MTSARFYVYIESTRAMIVFADGSAVKTTLVTTSSVTLLGWGYLVFEDGYQAADQNEALKDCLRWPLDYLLNSWQVQNRRLIRKVKNEITYAPSCLNLVLIEL